MDKICTACGTQGQVVLKKGEKTISVREEPITIDFEYYKCQKCGDEFIIPLANSDPFEKAYRIYRKKHGMVQPEEIREFRKRYKLTQGELTKLLGLGGATISRYEHGRLQDRTHDTLIKMAMNPKGLKDLVLSSVDVFQQQKKNEILRLIDGAPESKESTLNQIITVNFQQDQADEYSGFKKFDNDKFYNAVLYFCKGGVIKTKLNKLLFYADFKHFAEYTVSITGARYAHIPFGPAPDGYDIYYAIINQQGSINIEEIEFGEYTGEQYSAKQEPNLNVFSESELRILAFIKEYFGDFNAKRITEISHKEKGYQSTEIGESISYRHAENLMI